MRTGLLAVVGLLGILFSAEFAGGGVEQGSAWLSKVTIRNRHLIGYADVNGDIFRTVSGKERLAYSDVVLLFQSGKWQLGPAGIRKSGYTIDLLFTLRDNSVGERAPLAGSISYLSGSTLGSATTSDEILEWALATGANDAFGGSFNINRSATRIKGTIPITFWIFDSPGAPFDTDPDAILVNTVIKIKGFRIG